MKFIDANSKHIILFIFCTIIFVGCKKESPFEKEGWELTFNDEFNDTVLNRNVWKSQFPGGQSDSPANKYYNSDSAFTIKDGILHIVSKRDTILGLVHDDNYNYSYKTFYFTSGMLQSDDGFSQQYGYFEIRSKIPFGMGLWPAFWLMQHNDWPPEIDVFEIVGRQPNRLVMTNHYVDKKGTHQFNSHAINGPDFSKDFHKFGIEWNPKEIIWYLDDEEVFRSEVGIPSKKMFLIISNGFGGGFSGEIDNSTPFPNSLDVDYVRVYKMKK